MGCCVVFRLHPQDLDIGIEGLHFREMWTWLVGCSSVWVRVSGGGGGGSSNDRSRFLMPRVVTGPGSTGRL